MSLKQVIKKILPDFIKTMRKKNVLKRESKEFTSLKRLTCDTGNLISEEKVFLSDIFNSDDIHSLWEKSKMELDIYNIPDGGGGVNPGDRRAVYYLISKFKPVSVLEIGTHIGASTIHIATALKANGIKSHLTTVDIRDVNSVSDKPWVEYRSKYSPAQMIGELKCDAFTNFVTNTSLKYFEISQAKFDFIFLDGDHSASTVYKEIPLALKSLNTNGIILLHDYFPNSKPLWSNNSVIPGPYLATERLINEGADLTVLPLGNLPWATKFDSNITSLALLMKKS
jgi:predicted O-methyltransferase YrrM